MIDSPRLPHRKQLLLVHELGLRPDQVLLAVLQQYLYQLLSIALRLGRLQLVLYQLPLDHVRTTR
ncbi:hypothetical protein D3C80_1277810 [compost metagenome]